MLFQRDIYFHRHLKTHVLHRDSSDGHHQKHLVTLSLLRLQLLQYLFLRSWHHGTRRRTILALEIITHLLHGDPAATSAMYDGSLFEVCVCVCGYVPFYALVLVDMLNDSLVHQQNVRSAGNIWMDGHGKDKLVVLSVIVVEVILWKDQPVNQCVMPCLGSNFSNLTIHMASTSLGLTCGLKVSDDLRLCRR